MSIEDPLNVGETFLALLKDARVFLDHASTIQCKLDAFIAKLAPNFGNWLLGGDSMEGYYPMNFGKYLYEKAYTDKEYETWVARIDTQGNLTFQKGYEGWDK